MDKEENETSQKAIRASSPDSSATLRSKYFFNNSSAKSPFPHSKKRPARPTHLHPSSQHVALITASSSHSNSSVQNKLPSSTPTFSSSYSCFFTPPPERQEDNDQIKKGKDFLDLDNSNNNSNVKKTKRKPRGYAPPLLYQHLNPLPDLILPGLDVLFCGSNPGCESARISHYYGHPTNLFWKCLHLSGFTPSCLSPDQDHLLPTKFGLGLTDLVSRPTAESNELSTLERLEAVPILLEKIRTSQPRFLCFVGIKQYQDLCRYMKKKKPKSTTKLCCGEKTKVGLQNMVLISSRGIIKNVNPQDTSSSDSQKHCIQSSHLINPSTVVPHDQNQTFVFVCPSTSALVRNYQAEDRIECFKNLFNLKSKIDILSNNPHNDNFFHIQIDDLLSS